MYIKYITRPITTSLAALKPRVLYYTNVLYYFIIIITKLDFSLLSHLSYCMTGVSITLLSYVVCVACR